MKKHECINPLCTSHSLRKMGYCHVCSAVASPSYKKGYFAGVMKNQQKSRVKVLAFEKSLYGGVQNALQV